MEALTSTRDAIKKNMGVPWSVVTGALRTIKLLPAIAFGWYYKQS